MGLVVLCIDVCYQEDCDWAWGVVQPEHFVCRSARQVTLTLRGWLEWNDVVHLGTYLRYTMRWTLCGLQSVCSCICSTCAVFLVTLLIRLA